MAKAHVYVRKNMRSAVDPQRQAYSKDQRTYQPTQPVWLWTPRLRPGQSRKFALYWTGPWQIKRQLNELMYKITPHHSWASQGSEAVSINRLKPFHAMYVDALEHHCPPDPKADLKMLGDEFAEFIDSDLDEEIDAGPPAQHQWPAGAQQAPPPAAAGAAAADADPLLFGQLEHAAHPVPPAVFNNEEDAPYAPQMRLGQRQAGRGRRQRRMDAEAANGQYWDLGQPLPPAPLVREALAAENLHGQRREEYERRRAVKEGQLVNYNQAVNRRDRAAARNARYPEREEIMQDPGPVNLEAMIATISIPDDNWVVLDVPPWKYYADKYNAKVSANIFSFGPWKYYAEKYNAEMETEPVHCLVGQDLVQYLANREKDRKRSQSNPLGQRHNLEWCRQREDLDQEYIHNVLRTGLSKEGGRGRGSLHGQSGRRN
jgi:hypothetical protein